MVYKSIFDSDTGNESYASIAFISGVGIKNLSINREAISILSRQNGFLIKFSEGGQGLY